MDELNILGPIFVLKLRFVPPEFKRRVVAEIWLYPDGQRIMELSTKCAPGELLDTVVKPARCSRAMESRQPATSRRRQRRRWSSSRRS